MLERHPFHIVDVGASGGIDPRWRGLGAGLRAILFEPDPREVADLKAMAPGNDLVLNAALSDEAKVVEFHLCKEQMVSSVYLPNFPFLKRFPEAERFEVQETINIHADTLDNQLRVANISRVDFIKVDAQGHGLPILRGALDTLRNVLGLELEVEFAPIYKDQPLFAEMHTFVTQQGFELYDLKRHFWKRTDDRGQYRAGKGQLVFGDALYFRSPEAVCAAADVSGEKLVHAVLAYLAYGYTDLAVTVCNLLSRSKI